MLLAFDTTLDLCSVALLDNAGRLVAHISRPMARGHAEALVPMIDEALREAATGMDALKRIAVTTGPGTFTGVRVGVSAARGLALGLKLPVAGITSLDMLAGAVVFSGADREGSKILAAIDARRNQAYLALYEAGEATSGYPLRCLAAPAVVALEDARVWLNGNCAAGEEVRVMGSAAEILSAQDDRLRCATVDLTPDAGVVARLAACLPAPGWTGKPRALYLRAPDAKLPAGIK
ncbi:MAG: tRNA (adenosine(37)-N6)-threonylcarbamoyltransferase complex dimerization subunit type 1 TsaB [Proteobacteria bacterium]|nr:tRNA (adenosine(37)-N6)-threonylcarbamoyltransferase complex dimerization subunit type 1 TsaB [Pseudomonadota bacterium]